MKRTLIAAIAAIAVGTVSAAYTEHGAGESGMRKTSEKAVQSFKVHFAPKTLVPPVLDGKLDDPCWQGIDMITDYAPCTISQPQKRHIPRTEVKLLWDDKYLYVAAKCYEDTEKNWQSFLRIVNDKKRVFHGRDCIEMHIDGNNDEHTTFQCWLLANEEKYINWNYDFGWGILVDSNYGLNSDWSLAHSIGQDSLGHYWIVEARYALAHFELKPQVGYIFGFEPTRFRLEKEIYNPDMTVLSPNWGMWLAWGAQGQNHHNADKYGKVIFVDKKPASVAEGLKLAYPDLNERIIQVQTGSEYSVFDCGKESTLTYAEKAKTLISDTMKAVEKYEGFFAEVSNVVWKSSRSQVLAVQKEIKAAREMADKVAEMKEFGIGFINELDQKCGKWAGTLENGYWELVRDAMLVEGKTRVPVKIKADENAPDLGSEFSDVTFKPEERTHDIVEWAKPLAAGKKKTFITVNSTGGIDAWQLAKRLDVDAAIFQSTGGGGSVGVTSDYYNEGHWFTGKKAAELERALAEKGPFDAFVFIGTRMNTWPARLQCWLLEQTLAGAKVIEKNGGYGSIVNKFKLEPNKEIALGSPKGCKKLVRAKGNFKWAEKECSIAGQPLKVAAFGKGVVGAVEGEISSGWAHSTQGSPAWPTVSGKEFQDEYGFAYLVRNVMEVLGLRGERRAVEVGEGLAKVAAGKDVTVPFKTAGAKDWRGEIGWTLRRPDGSVVEAKSAAFTIPAGTNHVSLALSPLDPGEYYLDATLYAPGKKVLDFASGRVIAAYDGKCVKCGCSPNCRELLDAPAFTEVKLVTETLWTATQPVLADVKVAPVAAGLFVRGEIRDVRNRTIVRQDFPVDASGKVQVKLQNVPEYDWTLANLDLSLYLGEKQLAKETREFFYHRGNADDYQVFTASQPDGGWDGKMRMSYLANNGVTLAQQDYVPHFFSHGFDGVVRDRIPGGVPDKGGAVGNPWWLKHLTKRYGEHAKNMRVKNGRFISLGDDSGEAHEFPRTIPDWHPCWVEKQFTKCVKRADFWSRKGVTAPMREATEEWWREHGERKNGVDSIENNFWGFEAPMRNFLKATWVKKVEKPEDIKEIVDSFKEVYGTVRVFNRAANADVKDWKDIDAKLIGELNFDPQPDFVRFIFWLEKKYGGKIAELNKVWQTDFKDFPEITRAVIDEQQQKKIFGPSIDMQDYLEMVFCWQAKAIADGVHGQDSTIGLGFGASTLGNTPTESIKYLDSVCPYEGSGDIEFVRGQKHRYIGECIGTYGGRNVPVAARRKSVWHGLLTGCNFSWYWDSCYRYGDNSLDARQFSAMIETYGEIKKGPAQLLIRSKRENDGIRVMYSRDAGHLAPLVADMSTHGGSVRGLYSLAEAHGFQWDSITAEQVTKGGLNGVKLLMLPYLQIMTPAEMNAVRDFVKKGGVVIADARCAVYDVHGVPYEKPPMDDFFGISRTQFAAKPDHRDIVVTGLVEKAVLTGALVDTSIRATTAKAYGNCDDGSVAFLVNDYGKGKAIMFNFGLAVVPFLDGRNELGGIRDAIQKLFAMAGLKPMATLVDAAGKEITKTEFSAFKRDGEIYLGVEKSGKSCEKFPMQAFVKLEKSCAVYDVRAGKALGVLDKIPVTLTGLDTFLFALLPAECAAPVLEVPESVKPGELITAKVTIANLKATHPIRWELIPEGGYNREEFLPYPWRVKDAKAGAGETAWAIDFAAPKGQQWTVKATDVVTGASVSKTVTVR